MRIRIERHPGTPPSEHTVEAEVMDLDEHDKPAVVEIRPEAASRVVVHETFNGLTLITADGEVLVVNMRDSGFECAYETRTEPAVLFSLQRGEFGGLGSQRVRLAWLLWCDAQGYHTAADRGDNWMLSENLLNADDVAERSRWLAVADAVLSQ